MRNRNAFTLSGGGENYLSAADDQSTLLALGKNEASAFLARILSSIVELSDCTGAMLVAWHDDSPEIISHVGVPLSIFGEWNSDRQPKNTAVYFKRQFEILDTSTNHHFQEYDFIQSVLKWRYFANTPLLDDWVGVSFSIVCGFNYSGKFKAEASAQKVLNRLSELCANEFMLLLDFAKVMRKAGNNHVDQPVAQAVLEDQISRFQNDLDDRNVVSDFLLNTLINDRRLLRRKAVEYHAIYKWRKAIKSEQIKALRAIKSHGSDNLEHLMATGLATTASSLFGGETIKMVTNVPCGHSGRNCLIGRVAPRVAQILNIPYLATFADLPSSGSSHPKTNVRRVHMRLIEKPKVPVLLLDDVATSGRHIEEAATLLRKHSSTVLPVVWLAG